MQPTISVFGLGYVGSVTAACLAAKGNRVIGVDLNSDKIAAINTGRSPIVEPQVGEYIAAAHSDSRLSATADTAKAISESTISFICVGTPSQRNGRLDLSYVKRVCEDIGNALRHKREPHLVVLRSTVLPGSTDSIAIPALTSSSGKQCGAGLHVCVNPEFMREGTAVKDFFEPEITVIGTDDLNGAKPLRDLYSWVPGRIFETSLKVGEMVKYASNSYHALKVSFANELGTICRELGVDTQKMTEIFTADKKLNVSAAYLKPGFAFGGSCLPKDVRAITYLAKELDLRVPLLEAILPSNNEHIERAVESILSSGSRKIGFLGLSFKAGTDDLRESPSVQVIKRLLGEGCQVRIWDDNVSIGRLIGSNRQFIEDLIPHIGSLLCERVEDVISGADVIVVGTRAIPNDALERLITDDQTVIDLINLDKTRRLARASYAGICW